MGPKSRTPTGMRFVTGISGVLCARVFALPSDIPPGVYLTNGANPRARTHPPGQPRRSLPGIRAGSPRLELRPRWHAPGGTGGRPGRIDILATATRAGMTADDLAEFELAYSPPYGSVKDPVNMLGFVAQNLLDKTMPKWQAPDLDQQWQTLSFWMSGHVPSSPKATWPRRSTSLISSSVPAWTRSRYRPAAARSACTAPAVSVPISPPVSGSVRVRRPPPLRRVAHPPGRHPDL